ncbi:MAG: hypothetical protein AAB759_01310 [Patescibacteria group bacterium]
MPKRIAARFGLFARNASFGGLFENFVISAVFTIIVVRILLYLTDYPELGGERYHIAHMLWGGLLMLGALFLLFGFLGSAARRVASVVGGIGFGLFIDELGKFITRDNDYFFQPAIALIYAVFVIIFIVVRAGEHYLRLAPEDYAANALEIFREAFTRGLTADEQGQALAFLDQSDPMNPATVAFRKAFFGAPLRAETASSGLGLKARFEIAGKRTLHSRRFQKLLIIFFAVASIVNLGRALILFRSAESFVDLGQIVTAIVSGVLVIVGTWLLRRERHIAAYETYKYAVLVSIFFTQFFLFYREQLSAIFHLAVNLVVYLALRYLIEQEISSEHDRGEYLDRKTVSVA